MSTASSRTLSVSLFSSPSSSSCLFVVDVARLHEVLVPGDDVLSDWEVIPQVQKNLRDLVVVAAEQVDEYGDVEAFVNLGTYYE